MLKAHDFDDKWKLIVNGIDYEINDTGHDLVNQLNNSEKEILYAAGVLKISIVIEENNTVKQINVMIDSSMKINVLHKSVVNWLGFIITLLQSERMISATDSQTAFHDVSKHMLVQVEEFKFKISFFIINGPIFHKCVLGQSFEHQACLWHIFKLDERVETIIWSQNRHYKIIVPVFSLNNKWNQCWQDILHLQSIMDEKKETENWVLKLLVDWTLADRMICWRIGKIQCHMRRVIV